MTTNTTLLDKIESTLDLCGMSATRFGYLCMGDPAFVGKLRKGRRSRSATEKRVAVFLDKLARGDIQ